MFYKQNLNLHTLRLLATNYYKYVNETKYESTGNYRAQSGQCVDEKRDIPIGCTPTRSDSKELRTVTS
jgi:hypothetical protein